MNGILYYCYRYSSFGVVNEFLKNAALNENKIPIKIHVHG
jgi:hypothetical protein